MRKITLQIISNGKTKSIELTRNTLIQPVELGSKYQLLDENGELFSDVVIHIEKNDLVIFISGEEQPRLILKEYQTHYPVNHSDYLAEHQTAFITEKNDVVAIEVAKNGTK